MGDSRKREITQAEINDLFRDLGSYMTPEELRKRLDGDDEDVKFTTRKFIIDKGLTDRLLTAGWITEDQKNAIMGDSSKTVITQREINDLFRDLGAYMTPEELGKRLDGTDEDVQFTTRKFIIDKGLTDRLFALKWITEDQKNDIVDLGKILLPKSGGKRRYSTRSKKYKKNNKRSKRTRTLRSKRYSRKS